MLRSRDLPSCKDRHSKGLNYIPKIKLNRDSAISVNIRTGLLRQNGIGGKQVLNALNQGIDQGVADVRSLESFAQFLGNRESSNTLASSVILASIVNDPGYLFRLQQGQQLLSAVLPAKVACSQVVLVLTSLNMVKKKN